MKPLTSLTNQLAALLLLVATGVAAGPDIDGDDVDDSVDECSNTPPGILVDVAGRPIADHDLDCDVDLEDFDFFLASFTGVLTPPSAENCLDKIDNDGDTLADCADVVDCAVGTSCSAEHFCSQFATCGCPEGHADCDVEPATGCETDIDTHVAHCGACDAACPPPAHATPGCAAGECIIESCELGWCDADTFPQNGCEVPLNGNPTCSPPSYLGSISGDTGAGQLSTSGAGEKWFRVRLTEDNDGDVYLSATVEFRPAPGSNYDLYLYCAACGGYSGYSSNSGPGVVEILYPRWDDDFWGEDDSYDITIEVRWLSGGCAPYTLSVLGNTNLDGRPNTCNP